MSPAGAPVWLSWLSAWLFGSGYDLTVRGIQLHVGLRANSVEPAWDSLSPSLSACILPLEINKLF